MTGRIVIVSPKKKKKKKKKRETLHDVSDALTTSFGGQGVLEGSGGFLGLLRNLFRHGSCDQPAHNVSHDDPSHTTIRLLQSRRSPHTKSFNDLHGHISCCQKRTCCYQEHRVGLVVENGGQMVCCHSRRVRRCSSPRSSDGHHTPQTPQGPIRTTAQERCSQLPDTTLLWAMVAFAQDWSIWPTLPCFQVPQVDASKRSSCGGELSHLNQRTCSVRPSLLLVTLNAASAPG